MPYNYKISAINAANQLQKLVTGVMEFKQCRDAHLEAESGSPVSKAKNICAGGEEGMQIFYSKNQLILFI